MTTTEQLANTVHTLVAALIEAKSTYHGDYHSPESSLKETIEYLCQKIRILEGQEIDD